MCNARGALRTARILPVQAGEPVVNIYKLMRLTRNVLLGVEEVVVESVLAPENALVLVGSGVSEALGGAGGAAEEAAEVGALRFWK